MQLAKSEDFISKLNNVEKKLEKLVEVEKILYEKDCTILKLTRKVDNIEEKLAKTIALIDQNSKKPKKPQLKIYCEECEFEANSRQGLKVHMKRKHTLTGKENYPRKCDLCGLVQDNNKDLKEHMKMHNYKKANYQCDCDFLGDSQRTMEVHIGKHHLENIECGLCESEFQTKDELDVHLFTCETYTCNREDCDDYTVKSLEELKTHIREKHGTAVFIHIKMKRSNYNEVDKKSYYFSKDTNEVEDF